MYHCSIKVLSEPLMCCQSAAKPLMLTSQIKMLRLAVNKNKVDEESFYMTKFIKVFLLLLTDTTNTTLTARDLFLEGSAYVSLIWWIDCNNCIQGPNISLMWNPSWTALVEAMASLLVYSNWLRRKVYALSTPLKYFAPQLNPILTWYIASLVKKLRGRNHNIERRPSVS